MTRIIAPNFDDLSEELRQSLKFGEEISGFKPNSIMAMTHWPELLAAFRGIFSVIFDSNEIDGTLKRMMIAVISAATGCQYCQAHAALSMDREGVEEDKIKAVWEYQTSTLFSDAERAALDLAIAAAQVPNGATEAHFATAREHYSERQIVELMSVICLFGFINRWNDTLAIELEDKPFDFASNLLSPDQWHAGKHRSSTG